MILVLEDERLDVDTPDYNQWLSIVATICNVVRFFEALPVLFAPRRGAEGAAEVATQGTVPCLTVADLGPRAESDTLPASPYGVASPATVESLALPADEIHRLQNQNCALVTTAGDLPDTLEPKDLRPLVTNMHQGIAEGPS